MPGPSLMNPSSIHMEVRRSWLHTLVLHLVFAAMAGCSINPPVVISEVAPAQDRIRLDEVPFYPQTEFQCGPAALAGILASSGADISPQKLESQVYLPEKAGSLQIELLAATRRADRVPYILQRDFLALIEELNAGRPVLVFQNLRTPGFPAWHYAVLVGIDPGRNTVLLNSGKQQFLEMSAGEFMRTWAWGDHWALIALRPGELPVAANPLQYYRSVAAFEAVSKDRAAAMEAWRAGAERWPDNAQPHLAMGNQEFKSGNFLDAISHFERGLQLRPEDAVLQNNLAEAIFAAGCPRLAEKRLANYLETMNSNSPWRRDIEATLDRIQTSRDQDQPACAQTEALLRSTPMPAQLTTPSSPSVK